MSPEMSRDPSQDSPEPAAPRPLVEALGALYRPMTPVPPDVDAAVLARARLRLGAPRRRIARWAVPLAAAAGLVLAIGLYQQVSSPTAYEQEAESGGLASPATISPGSDATAASGPSPVAPDPELAGAQALLGNPRPGDAVVAGTVVARGDVDRDGRVDILDAFTLARRLESLPAGESAALALSGWDQNSDGVVDRRDVDAIALMAVRVE